jgi:DNA polymerase III alpha subunit
MMTPEQQSEVRRIAFKRKSGEALTTEEIGIARSFKEFDQFGESSAIARARAAGGGDIFTGVAAERDRLAREAAAAAEAVAKAEVTFKERKEIVFKLEHDPIEDVLDEQFERLKKEILDLEAERDRKVKQAIQGLTNKLNQGAANRNAAIQ